jgi:hypothetical protein
MLSHKCLVLTTRWCYKNGIGVDLPLQRVDLQLLKIIEHPWLIKTIKNRFEIR